MLVQLLEHLHAVDARHHHVDDDGIERQRPRQIETFGAVGREADGVALADQERFEDFPHDLLVVDDEDRGIAPHSVSASYLATAVG